MTLSKDMAGSTHALRLMPIAQILQNIMKANLLHKACRFSPCSCSGKLGCVTHSLAFCVHLAGNSQDHAAYWPCKHMRCASPIRCPGRQQQKLTHTTSSRCNKVAPSAFYLHVCLLYWSAALVAAVYLLQALHMIMCLHILQYRL